MKRITVIILISVFGLLATALAALASPVAQTAPTVPPLMPPMMNGQQRPCLECHHLQNLMTTEGALSNQAFCLECHQKADCVRQVGEKKASLTITPESFGPGRHQAAACVSCHTDVARSPHQTVTNAQCLGCHPVHGGGMEPHLTVDCQACHNQSESVERNPESGRIVLARTGADGNPIGLTDHKLADVNDSKVCGRCHHFGNLVGASVLTLPEKSVLCIVCHDTGLGLSSWIFWVAAAIFLFGVAVKVHFWFQGQVAGESQSLHRKVASGSDHIWNTVFSREFWSILKTFFLDVLLQRRLLKESVRRWMIHSLIYLAFLGRFLLGLFTLMAYSADPEGSIALTLINKNAPFTAFMYDLLGLMILIGVVWAAVQRFVIKPKHAAGEIQDTTALIIIGLLVLFGFILEGGRIVMTQVPSDLAVYSFVGYPVSRFLSVWSPKAWTYLYPILWYVHAVLGAGLIAWLPFSKMRHVLVTPISLILNRKLQ